MKYIFSILIFLTSLSSFAQWDPGTEIPAGGRPNPFSLEQSSYNSAVISGKLWAITYPMKETAILPPLRPVEKLLNEHSLNPLREIFQQVVKGFLRVKSFNDILRWAGLHPYPKVTDTGVYSVPYPGGQRPDYLMGFTPVNKNGTLGFTIGCAACHSSNLFGKTVLGLTNRFPKGNEAFIHAKKLTPYFDPFVFRTFNGATKTEAAMMMELKENLKSVGVRPPLVAGLDTSLAQVSLSLAKRDADAWATKNQTLQKRPRFEELERTPADSKPAVWWNLKYKNRWLSDGSIVSGNPILTNILWNEIGRGIDLKTLDSWFEKNKKTIEELTTAVFSIEPPLFTDFFPVEKINLDQAKLGEKVFLNRCSKCHGTYEKAWNLPHAESLSPIEKLKTSLVKYKPQTQVKDVGTDPLRYLGMKSLEQLNNLEISKNIGTLVIAQKGYVPPPLVGIWARWPYFHNNSVPSLCAVLTPAAQRPVTYYAGPANRRDIDFDSECNGYPLGDKTPQSWKKKVLYYDTREEGLSNSGHDEGIIVKDGVSLITSEDRKNLIQFLQTL